MAAKSYIGYSVFPFEMSVIIYWVKTLVYLFHSNDHHVYLPKLPTKLLNEEY